MIWERVLILKIRFFDVAVFTTITWLSLLSFLIVGLKISYFPTFSSKFNKIFMWYFGS